MTYQNSLNADLSFAPRRTHYEYTGARKRQIRRRKTRKRAALFAVICIAAGIFLGSFLFSGVKSEAANNYVQVTNYTSVRVEDGMTLSSIEEEYNTSDDVSAEQYINDVKVINHLKDSTIHSSSHLLVPSYDKVIE